MHINCIVYRQIQATKMKNKNKSISLQHSTSTQRWYGRRRDQKPYVVVRFFEGHVTIKGAHIEAREQRLQLFCLHGGGLKLWVCFSKAPKLILNLFRFD